MDIPVPSKWKGTTTRHVIDRTLGGDIVYFDGRLPRDYLREWHYLQKRCTPEEFSEWIKRTRAREIK